MHWEILSYVMLRKTFSSSFFLYFACILAFLLSFLPISDTTFGKNASNVSTWRGRSEHSLTLASFGNTVDFPPPVELECVSAELAADRPAGAPPPPPSRVLFQGLLVRFLQRAAAPRGIGQILEGLFSLYRSQILQVNMRLKALAEIYTMHSFAQL